MNDYGWGIAVGILVIAASLGKALAALIRAHAARIDRTHESQDDPRLAEMVEGLQQRLGELEERLDFTERVLAKQGEPDRLAPPQSQPTS
jgi:hypothetical protein